MKYGKNGFDGAFPIVSDNWNYEGMTLRDYFAAKAMVPVTEYELGPSGVWQHFCPDFARSISNHAYMIADALLKERDK